MPFSVDTKLGVLLANEKARAVLEKHLPGISTHPQVHLAKGLTTVGERGQDGAGNGGSKASFPL